MQASKSASKEAEASCVRSCCGDKPRRLFHSSLKGSSSSIAPQDLPAWVRPRPTWCGAFGTGLVLSTRLALWALAIVTICLIPWTFSKLQQESLEPNMSQKEPALSLTEICRRRPANLPGRIWCHDIRFGNFPVALPIFMFPAVSFALIVKLGKVKTVVLLLMQFCIYVTLMSFYLSPVEELEGYQGTMAQVAFLCPTVFLFVTMPRQSRVWRASLGLVAISALGLFLMTVYDGLKLVVGDLIFLCMIWPIIREFFFFAARRTARYVAMNPNVGGAQVQLRRQYAWSIVLIIQVFLATWFRLMATKLQDRATSIIFIFLSSIQEIIFRVTVRERENFIASIARFGSASRSEDDADENYLVRRLSVVAPVTQRRISHTSHKVSHKLAQTEWYALLAIGEMLAEHLALWTVLGLIILFHDSVLALPLPFFDVLEKPFEEQVDLGYLILYTLGQLVAEIMTDCICVTLEQRMRGYPLQVIWETMSLRVRVVNLLLATFTGLSLALTLFFEAESGSVRTEWCAGEEICSCKPPVNNLHGRYCTYIGWNYTLNGIPSS